ncbi:hypothetical protein [Piscirickettsia salmonis]|uniref:hypothetical protein n=1 Tax=Piscirickettsia salmonis TaxID=1238 RepID=UPI0007C8D480
MKKSFVIILVIIALFSCFMISFIAGGANGFLKIFSSLLSLLEWGILGFIIFVTGLFVIFGSIVVCAAVWDELFKKKK